MKKTALLIEDKETQLIVRTALECAGFEIEIYASTVPLLRAIKRDVHGVVVADVDNAGTDCGALLAWRHNWLNPAVTLVAIGSADALAAAEALNAGMDDFVAKPVRGAELLARIGAAIRRRQQAVAPTGLTLANCRIDLAASAIISSTTRVELTSRELALAQLLFESAGQVVTRAKLAHDVWGQSDELTGHSIEQHIYQLRRKLKRCSGDTITLRGVYGSGYRIDVTTPTGPSLATKLANLAALSSPNTDPTSPSPSPLA